MRKNLHRLGHSVLTTGDLGELLPIGCVEVLPGDVFRHGLSAFVRLTPQAAPVMHELDVRFHAFYVPHRIVWEDAGGTGTFEDFITGGNSGADTQTVPTITTTGTAGDLLDYYGCPGVAGIEVSALPIAGYNRIFNEWYRDQDLVSARNIDATTVANIAWEKDYFTSARPWPQRGDAISLPLGTTAPVTGLAVQGAPLAGNVTARETGGTGNITLTSRWDSDNVNTTVYVEEDANNAGFPGVFADLSAATAATVADLRLAFALQRFAELRAQLGARYPEYLARYGVRDADGRIQVPELLGGGSAKVAFSEVLQTSPDDPSARGYSTGDLYGHGIAALRAPPYRRRFPEWGYVHTFLSIRPRTMYMDGIPRTLLRQDREDFFLPELEGIGEQPVTVNEVFASVANGANTFGYQGRYDEYRSEPSKVSGEFRDTLDYWHLGRTFAAEPALNETFVTCSPSKRVFNEQTQHSAWIRVRHSINALRPVGRRARTRAL